MEVQMKKLLLAVAFLAAVVSTAFAVDAPVVPKKEDGVQTVNVNEIKAFDAKEMMKKIPIASEKINFTGYFFAPGQLLNLHKHPGAEEFFYIVEGDGQFTVGNSQTMVTTGSVIYGPANVPHGFVNSSHKNVIMVSVQGPKPVKIEYIDNSTAKCAVCGQENIIPENAKDGDIIVCPKCHQKIKISKQKDGSWKTTPV
jgi:quercetin dioxygenase-like cupin family protein/DNA-directed RNA polymerase subunit RPC12/RpoP